MARLDCDIMLKIFKKKLDKMVKECEDDIIEKIAFALFSMCHYKHRLYSSESNCLFKSTFNELKETWKLGKIKGEVQYFILLAKEILKIDLSNKEEKEHENK